MRAASGFLGCQMEKDRQVSQRTFGQFPLVEREEMREIGAWRPAIPERLWVDMIEPEFGDGPGKRTREPWSERYRCEIKELIRAVCGVNDARCQRFDAQTAYGRELLAGHGLCCELGGELREGQSVDALTAWIECGQGEFACGCAGGGYYKDFRICSVEAEERGGAV